jgi:hypothetical protein
VSIAGSQIGQAVDRLQWRCLVSLRNSSIGDRFSLCGGAALHGCYIRQSAPALCRPNVDLDIHTDYALAVHLAEEASEIGLLGVVDGGGSVTGAPLYWESTDLPGAFRVSMPGTVTTRVQTLVDLYARRPQFQKQEEALYRSSDGQSIAVQVQPLGEILVTKLGYMLHQRRLTDVYDIWCGLLCVPDVVVSMRQILDDPGWMSGRYPVCRPFWREATIERLQSFEDDWIAFRETADWSIPEFFVVYRDLTTVLVNL